jgi:hypothetical protein
MERKTMSEKYERVTIRLAPETRSIQERELEQLKQRLLLELLNQSPESAFDSPIRRAANDAAALAWTTPQPILVFPVLLEEMAAAAGRQVLRQERIHERSRGLIAEVE